jgi:branched-chain amino acid transport system ATP-binding protein/branched-chain amino acid transport system permease protein
MAATAALEQTRVAVAGAAREARAAWSRRATAAVCVVAAAALLPALPVDVGFDRLASDVYLGAAAVGLGIVVGLGGMPSLGQSAFLALGAFGAARLGGSWGWPTEAAVIGGTLVAVFAGAVVGIVAAILRPALVAVFTWLFAWLVAIGLVAFPSISGGARGITVETSISATAHYELAVALAALAVLLYAVLARSPAGIALSAASERGDSAETLGVPVVRLRTGAFTAGAGIAGLAGGLAVYLAGVADAAAYEPLVSAKLFIAVVLGGAISPAGGLVGVAVLSVLGRLADLGDLEGLQANRVETLLIALIVVSALGVTDRGLLPSLADWRRRRARREPQTGDAVRPGARPAPRAAPLMLEARGLTKRFGPITAVERLDLTLDPGTVHALIGPNGSGKTTALRLLAGALPPHSGTIVAGGEELTGLPLQARVERGIVRTPQATAVFSELTALENALVGARLRLRHGGGVRAVFATPKARVETRAARTAALEALELVGLGAVRDVRAEELSGAAQRRLMIAAALATAPRVLFLDEPAAGASRVEVSALADLIAVLRESGLAILLVDHNLRLVRGVADHVTVLAAGRAIASGTLDEVVGDEAVLRAYLGGRPL